MFQDSQLYVKIFQVGKWKGFNQILNHILVISTKFVDGSSVYRASFWIYYI